MNLILAPMKAIKPILDSKQFSKCTNRKLHILNSDQSDQSAFRIVLSYNKSRIVQEPQIHRKLQRNDYKMIASNTKYILQNQCFLHPVTKQSVDISSLMSFSLKQTKLYQERYTFSYCNIDGKQLRKYREMDIEINHETTLDAAYRLRGEYGNNTRMVMLNFSSARNPGGGWDTGSVAQEESIARSSTLIPTLMMHYDAFYEYHRRNRNMLYSHALIYSPNVVVMKHGNGRYIERGDGYYLCDVVTSPAVNAKNYVKRAHLNDDAMRKYGGYQRSKGFKGTKNKTKGKERDMERECAAWNVVEHVMTERIRRVLELCLQNGNEVVILGAWGCGVFGNDPAMIANIFAELLANQYRNVFRKVVFAILDDRRHRTIDKFVRQFENVLSVKGIQRG